MKRNTYRSDVSNTTRPGDGIARLALEILDEQSDYRGILLEYPREEITAHHVFSSYEKNDVIAIRVIQECIEYWGMATANLISLFNPEKIIFGGGVFGPAIKFIPAIKVEADKWAQPISRTKVTFESSALSGNASLYGAGYLCLKKPSIQIADVWKVKSSYLHQLVLVF